MDSLPVRSYVATMTFALRSTPMIFLLVCLAVSSPGAALALTDATVFLGSRTEALDLSSRVTYTLDAGNLDVEAVDASKRRLNWAHYTGAGALSMGYQKEAVWLTLLVNNTATEPSELILELGWPLLADVEFYSFEAGRWISQSGGYNAGPGDQAIQHRSDLFTVTVPGGAQKRVYLRVKSDGVILLPLNLWQRDAFYVRDQGVNVLLGLFFGALGVMLLYNLSLAILTREPAYLAYVLYVAAVMAFQANVTGVGALYFWGESTWLQAHSYSLTSSLGFATATLFSIRFLELRRNSLFLFRAAQCALVFWLGLVAMTPILSKETLGLIGYPVGLATCALAFFGALYLALKGNRSALYFVIAWSFLILGAVLYITSMAGMIPRTPVTEYAQSIGVLVEVILLSFALAERINRTSAERASAQQRSLDMAQQLAVERAEKIDAQNAALAIQQRTTEELEARVRERTLALENTLGELAEANGALEKASLTDPLTGCFNRRYFDSEIMAVVKRCNRSADPLAVLFLDIDHFKDVNDTHGHSAGDHCLQAVAAVVQAHFGRAGDLLARYGGEEFVAVLPATSEPGALALAERARAAVAGLDIELDQGLVNLTVSIGIACWVPEPHEDAASLLAAADNALYTAKRRGRNRVEIALRQTVGPVFEPTPEPVL